jgi:hypothetical protein
MILGFDTAPTLARPIRQTHSPDPIARPNRQTQSPDPIARPNCHIYIELLNICQIGSGALHLMCNL